MRVFISADIEGTTFTTLWDETELGHNLYAAAAKQMTAEVKATLHISPFSLNKMHLLLVVPASNAIIYFAIILFLSSFPNFPIFT